MPTSCLELLMPLQTLGLVLRGAMRRFVLEIVAIKQEFLQGARLQPKGLECGK